MLGYCELALEGLTSARDGFGPLPGPRRAQAGLPLRANGSHVGWVRGPPTHKRQISIVELGCSL